MRSHSCSSCAYHSARSLGNETVEVDEGIFAETPVFEHLCTASDPPRRQSLAELEFGCGLFLEVK
ncbi:MAG: hypothetical protein IJ592_02850 [Candidatus Methanomethylophilaceae archaeon]|nr:hypothetical protein [Candidatus Methanomethylophilaceae archaeon]